MQTFSAPETVGAKLARREPGPQAGPRVKFARQFLRRSRPTPAQRACLLLWRERLLAGRQSVLEVRTNVPPEPRWFLSSRRMGSRLRSVLVALPARRTNRRRSESSSCSESIFRVNSSRKSLRRSARLLRLRATTPSAPSRNNAATPFACAQTHVNAKTSKTSSIIGFPLVTAELQPDLRTNKSFRLANYYSSHRK